ncbi:metal-sensitive transcriptional regulator [Effusibacillus consociatus]|uniref:Metal-sensitive transcriptional regulator n=1 Tax=Effusibacillus consociatus TaxID=1117041 RepID=A0ABV9Q346_9BACL
MKDTLNNFTEYDDSIKHRLRRIEGQIRGVLNMIDQEKECRDVITQLTAIRSAVDRAIVLVLASNMEVCIREELQKGNNPEKVVQEWIDLLMKSR